MGRFEFVFIQILSIQKNRKSGGPMSHLEFSLIKKVPSDTSPFFHCAFSMFQKCQVPGCSTPQWRPLPFLDFLLFFLASVGTKCACFFSSLVSCFSSLVFWVETSVAETKGAELELAEGSSDTWSNTPWLRISSHFWNQCSTCSLVYVSGSPTRIEPSLLIRKPYFGASGWFFTIMAVKRKLSLKSSDPKLYIFISMCESTFTIFVKSNSIVGIYILQ